METTQSAAPAASASTENSNSEATESQEASSPEAAAAEALANPATPAAEKAEIKKQLKKLTLKVHGKQQEVEFDPNDDEFLTRELQKSRAFEKSAQDFSELEKQAKHFIEELRKNPKKVLNDPNLGVDIKKLAAEIIEEEIANSQKSPELLAKEKLEAELKSLKEEREKEKEEDKKKEFERIQEREYERYETLMTQALEKSELPKTPYTVKKMADYLLMGLQAGVDVTPQDVLPLVREEMQEDLKQMFAVMPDEVIEKLIGKDVFTRMRKKNIAKAKNAPVPGVAGIKDTGGTPVKKEGSDAASKKTFREYFGV